MTTETTTPTQTMAQLGPILAQAMGPGWTYRPWKDASGEAADHSGYLDGPERAELHVMLGTSWGRHRGRLSVSGSWPRKGDRPYGDEYRPNRYGEAKDAGQSISLDPARPPAVLARDIARRVLPAYLAELPHAYARKAQDEAQTTATLQAARIVADEIGARFDEAEIRDATIGAVKLWSPLASISQIHVSYGGAVRIETTSLPLPVAMRVLALLVEYDQGEKEATPEA